MERLREASEDGWDGGSEWGGLGGEGVHERGQVQHHILPVRWLWGRGGAEEERLAPRDACRMLTTGRKNSAIQSACLPRAPAWVGKVSAKSKRLPTTLEAPGIPTRRVRC